MIGIVANSHRHAEYFARENHLAMTDWIYLDSPHSIAPFNGSIIMLTGWWHRPDADDFKVSVEAHDAKHCRKGRKL